MKTEVVKITDLNWDEKVKHLGEIIRNGGLVAFPTETVYGLGGNGLNPEAAKKIYAAKGRPSDNPLILHVSSQEEVSRPGGRYHATGEEADGCVLAGTADDCISKEGHCP